jgi:hypothetical protein
MATPCHTPMVLMCCVAQASLCLEHPCLLHCLVSISFFRCLFVLEILYTFSFIFASMSSLLLLLLHFLFLLLLLPGRARPRFSRLLAILTVKPRFSSKNPVKSYWERSQLCIHVWIYLMDTLFGAKTRFYHGFTTVLQP